MDQETNHSSIDEETNEEYQQCLNLVSMNKTTSTVTSKELEQVLKNFGFISFPEWKEHIVWK